MGIAVVVSGIPELRSTLAQVKAAGLDRKQLFEEIGQAMQGRIELRFTSKTAPDGTQWAALKPSTALAYAKQDASTGNGLKSGSLLVRSGLMRESLTRITLANSVTVGFARTYASHHETGTGRKKEPLAKLHETGTETMIARPLIFVNYQTGKLSTKDREAILKIARNYIERQIP